MYHHPLTKEGKRKERMADRGWGVKIEEKAQKMVIKSGSTHK